MIALPNLFLWYICVDCIVRSPGMTEMTLLEKDISQYVYCEVYTRLSDPLNHKKHGFYIMLSIIT